MSKIKIIAHPETGKLFTETSNPDFVKCQLSSEEVVVNNGVIQLQKRVAFPLLQAKVVAALGNLKDGSAFPLPGKIIRTVTSTPQWENQAEVVNPTTREPMKYYQSYTFTTDANAQDIDLRGASADEVEQAVAAGDAAMIEG